MTAPLPPRAAQRLEGDEPVPPEWRGSVVAVGNFDGVHRGHLAVLQTALLAKRDVGRPAVVLTFEPHPRKLFGGEPVFRLTPPGERALLLGMLGFAGVVEQPFTREFASLEAEEFVQRILVDRLAASRVVVGHDFRFGAGRRGDVATLAANGAFTTVEAAAFEDGGEPISSSRIRAALGTGDVETASALLGRRWRISAPVSHGRKVGRTLGYPTANMALPPSVDLAHGIYAVRYRRADGTLHDGVASYGRRPTFDDGAALLETFLFDFDGDLYGETGHVSLFAFLRGERKFDGVEALIAQMDRDSLAARAALAAATPLSEWDRMLNFP